MKDTFYDGSTGLDPLDHAIKNADKFGWSHHIERLMILSNNMVHAKLNQNQFINGSWKCLWTHLIGLWFQMFMEWVCLVMNFATKPYICGSSYFMKMMDFKRATELCLWMVFIGASWIKIENFLKNPSCL